VEFPLETCLTRWRSAKTLAREKFCHLAAQLDYRLKWYEQRRGRRPEARWPDEVLGWQSLHRSLGDGVWPYPLADGTEQIRDYLLGLDSSVADIREADDFVIPADGHRNWAPGAHKEHRAIYRYFAKKLSMWLESEHHIALPVADAGGAVYTSLLIRFVGVGELCREFYKNQDVDELIKVMIREGHSAIYIAKIVWSYQGASMQMKYLLDRIRIINGGTMPVGR
jgi:hypothetical protein